MTTTFEAATAVHDDRIDDAARWDDRRIGVRDRGLRVVRDRVPVDLDAAERAVRDLLVALGHDPSTPHLADTPRRSPFRMPSS